MYSMVTFVVNQNMHGTCSETVFCVCFFNSDKFVPVWHSLQEIATRANTNPEAKRTHTQRKRKCEPIREMRKRNTIGTD